MAPDSSTDRLQNILQRGSAFGEEHDAVGQAVRVLGLDAANPEVDHPLVDLYRALRIASQNQRHGLPERQASAVP